jgi:Icc-related predicted phosphoesterase
LKILAVSDAVLDQLYSAEIAEHFRDVELILGCGDLPYEYLEFLVSMLNVPLLYVPGNHDPKYNLHDPAAQANGCELLDHRVARVKGFNLAGLGGSIRYKPVPPNQYTQAQMYFRSMSLLPGLLKLQIHSQRRLDFMVAHSPPYGMQDDDDPAHVGFLAFRDLIRIFKPRYFLHGHTLANKINLTPPVTKVGPTTVINVNPYRLLEVDPYVR